MAIDAKAKGNAKMVWENLTNSAHWRSARNISCALWRQETCAGKLLPAEGGTKSDSTDNRLVSKRILSNIRRVSRLAEHWLAALAVIAVAGCQTTSGPVHSPESALATVTVPEPLMVALPAPLPLPPIETNEPAVASSGPYWPREWVNAWVPLESWGRFNGLHKPVQLTAGTEALFQLQTSNGLLLLKMGSHAAHFGGQEYELGFAPRLIKGLPYLHSLDAQKTFQVLLSALFQ